MNRLLYVLLSLLAGAPLASAATTQPSRITLKVDQQPANATLSEIARQLGAPLATAPADLLSTTRLAPVSLDVKDQPFWQVLKALSAQAGIEPIQPSPDENMPRVVLGQGKGDFWKAPHAIAGPVLLVANDISRTQSVELGREKHQFERNLTLELSAIVEPGLKVLSLSPQVAVRQAVDDLGKSLASKPPDEAAADAQEESAPTGAVWTLNVELAAPRDLGKLIRKLAGTLVLRVQTESERIEIDGISKARNLVRPVGASTATIRSFKKVNDQYVLMMQVRRDKRSRTQWIWLHQSLNAGQLMLLDEKGKVVCARSTESNVEFSPNRIDADLHFSREDGQGDPLAGEPTKLVWEMPTAAKDLKLDFEFHDLAVPE